MRGGPAPLQAAFQEIRLERMVRVFRTGLKDLLPVWEQIMPEETLERLARLSKRSKSFLAAEAIAAYVEAEEWQLGEIQAGIAGLDRNEVVTHERVSAWLRSWGTGAETKAPR